jgi:ribonuclease BN (tRNA processing enzyme)
MGLIRDTWNTNKRDAVLVDTFVTVEQVSFLVDWVKASGKNLTTIYITHGHGDHNGVHLMLAESPNAQKRREWIAALGKIESLKPRAVIAGHKRPGNEDSSRIIEETRQYIRDFDRATETASTARELYDQMLKMHPNRMNPTALWASVRAMRP